jgi:DNA-binding beta-propeller fold protein YncE
MSFGSRGEGDGQFNYVEDFDLSVDGTHLLVTDALNAVVQIFDKATGKFLTKFGGLGSEPDKLVKPEGISTAPDGRIFVADYTTGFVKVYDKDYKWLKTFSNYGDKPGENAKSEFTCIHNGKYYMPEAGNHRISVWDLDGKFIECLCRKGADEGCVDNPQACKTNSRGELCVTDLNNKRVVVLDSNGRFVRKWGNSGVAPGRFNAPAGLSIDKHDNVYVTEIGNNRIQVFDRHGNFITMFGKKGADPGEFGNLHGCFVDKATGWLYVADTANNRVQVFKPTADMTEKLAGILR